MEKYIQLKCTKARKEIQTLFGVTPGNLSQSLNFVRNGDRNQRIRLAAMEKGGKLLREVKEWSNNDLK